MKSFPSTALEPVQCRHNFPWWRSCTHAWPSAVLLLAVAASAQPVIRALRGAGQQTVYGSAFPAPLVVWVTNSATGVSLSGVRVLYTSSAAIGLSASYATTDERGLASVTATGLAACSSQASAEVVDFPGARATFSGLVVEKAPLSVVPADLNATMGGPIPPLVRYAIEGLVNGDTEATANITGSPVLTTTATNRSRHANYAIKGGPGTLSSPNYTFVAGFGTMAILGDSDSGSQQQEASLTSSTLEDSTDVRPALNAQPASRPAFLAGLRGQSGVFVRDAIWQSATAASQASSRPLAAVSTRSVLPAAPASAAKLADTPVRAVVLPRLAAAGSPGQLANTRSALAVMSSGVRQQPTAPVRVAIAPGKPAAAQFPVAQPVIRKALNAPITR